MQKIFDEVNSLDQACYTQFALSSDLLMEHAASAMADYIRQKFPPNSTIAVVTGSGHNGADGIAMARLLHGDYQVSVLALNAQQSEQGKLQETRAKAVGVEWRESIESADVIVDAIFGSGLNRELDESYQKVIEILNAIDAFKLSCDIPSGIMHDGLCSKTVFKADVTITMGALKSALFSDQAKEFVGEIRVADLGVSRTLYEKESTMFLLEASDMKLPHRHRQNTHKGSFGHTAVVSGEKEGAAVLAAMAALSFGSGLVTVVTAEKKALPYALMQDRTLPETTTAIALGMGLGTLDEAMKKAILQSRARLVVDADLFYHKDILEFLDKEVVLTPHPKEFCALLKITGVADIEVDLLQQKRLHYAKLFCEHFPRVTLLLKGANVIIAAQEGIYINSLGSSALSKGGSGDVLSGLIAALLAQGYERRDAAITASLAHTLAAQKIDKNSYALMPEDIIKEVAHL